ncbi:hypothetical protein TrLO_g2707 [Triparma laevis f. longispina]|uniref:Adenylate kinase isoenzyme 6 homolog n=1 Tax=Triparma laevis f. longispina TaxID=1714387 RepID=A0A9W7DQW2_9STRA|nr:hypothetical protein TrLO_g2707 [Triparma laevis f. longispina]
MSTLTRPERAKPNILITGTPGTGKSTTSADIAEALGFAHLNVGDIVKSEKCYESRDEEFDAYMLDDDKLIDEMEPMVADGGCVVDFHSCEMFPERWFDLVLVLRASTEVLFDRLTERNYSEKKREENMTAEIMQVVAEEARESYAEEIVHEVQSNTVEDMEANVERVKQWAEAWKANNP